MNFEREMISTAVIVLASILTPLSSLADDRTAHPAYTNWSRFPVGTRVISKSTTFSKGQESSSVTTTTTLVRKDENAIVIRKNFRVKGEPEPNPEDGVETTIKRFFPFDPGAGKSKSDRASGSSESETEKVELLGKTYDAHRYETRATTEAGPSTTQTWSTDEIPGQVVRSITEVKAGGKKVVEEVIAIEIPGTEKK